MRLSWCKWSPRWDQGIVRADAARWPLAYTGPFFGLLIGLGLLLLADRPTLLRRRRRVPWTLHFYFGRKFLRSFLGVLLIFFAVLTLTGLIEQIRRFGEAEEANFATLLMLAVLNVPEDLYRILPLIMILATLALFLGLARSSELVVTRASGRSAMKSLVAPVLIAIFIGVFGVAAVNPIVASTQKQYEAQAARLSGNTATLSVSAEGLLVAPGQSRRTDGDPGQPLGTWTGPELFDVTFLGYESDGRPTYRIEAESARLVVGAWSITNAKEWRFDTDALIPEVDQFRDRQHEPCVEPDPQSDTRQLRHPERHSDLGTSAFHRATRSGRVFGPQPPHFLPHGTGNAAAASGDGACGRRFHHAAHADGTHRPDGDAGAWLGLSSVLHPEFRSHSWRERTNSRSDGRLVPAAGFAFVATGASVASGGRMRPRLHFFLIVLAVFTGFSGARAQELASLVADNILVDPRGRVTATGNVEVFYDGVRLTAQSVSYDREGSRLTITGPIRVTDADGTLFLADQAELDRDLRNGVLISARMVLDQQLQIAATEIARVGDRYTRLDRVVASSCEVCASNPVPLWEIRAARVVHDDQARQLYFTNAQLRFIGVPVAYIPRLRLPDPDAGPLGRVPDAAAKDDFGPRHRHQSAVFQDLRRSCGSDRDALPVQSDDDP